VSVASNLAEGGERDTDKESIRYFFIAKGSVAEIRTQLQIAQESGHLNGTMYETFEKEYATLGKGIGKLIQARRTSPRLKPLASGLSMSLENIWLTIGFLGQGLFFGRWVVQWVASEKNAKSQVPVSFWYMSLIGGIITLAYAIYRKDPVFIAGQGIGSIVYIRNLMLISRTSQANPPVSPSSPQT
jgi:lipid-A-disaccharide synthase-like uncharacterized protein